MTNSTDFTQGLQAGVCLAVGGSGLHWLTLSSARFDAGVAQIAVTVLGTVIFTGRAAWLVLRESKRRQNGQGSLP
jgi:hypothetical protein